MTETTSSSEARRDDRLEDPDVELRTDPRLHPGLLADLAALGLDGRAAPPPFDRSAGLEAIAEFLGGAHAGFTQVYEAVPSAWPDEQPASVDYRSEAITGPGGNEIKLHIHRPADTAGVLPCVVHIHGGGMTILDTDHPVFRRWNTDLAAAGLVTVSVGFRNAWTPGGLDPFPAGLNDCAAGIDWVHEHRTDLGITKIVLEGESGGGNLVLASALKAKRESRLASIDGVFSVVPYISGGWRRDISRKLRELPSLVENDGHFLNVPMRPARSRIRPDQRERREPALLAVLRDPIGRCRAPAARHHSQRARPAPRRRNRVLPHAAPRRSPSRRPGKPRHGARGGGVIQAVGCGRLQGRRAGGRRLRRIAVNRG